MLAFLRDANTSASVIALINLLDEALGAKAFSRLFPVILTDNGNKLLNVFAPRTSSNKFMLSITEADRCV